MKQERPDPAVFVIFGGGGDLTHRKLIPAFYNLYLEGWTPEHFAIIGVDRREFNDDAFRAHLLEGINEFSRGGKAEPVRWNEFASRICYITADFADDGIYAEIAGRVTGMEQKWLLGQVNQVFYLAIPPSLIEMICEKLGRAGFGREDPGTRIVVEKPFGHNLESARELDEILSKIFDEDQIYRIDHYLGKETVQNILAFRFANSLFEPLWNRRYIDHVQITVAERIGVGHRGGYYDKAGALRDMVQNHLSQVLCLIAMEPPVSFAANEIRNKKVDVLQSLRPIPLDQIHHFAVRGQYGKGWMGGKFVQAYREEPDVNPQSTTDTFAALKYFIDNWRWQDVPFYLRTGKRLAASVSEIIIQFSPVPHQAFPVSAIGEWQPNRLAIRIQPDEGIALKFQAKYPGQSMKLSTVEMRFDYKEIFDFIPPEAYENLLLDVLQGDPTQFMRADQIELAWALIDPILTYWEEVEPGNFPNYASGTWGPEEAVTLVARDGRTWIAPTVVETGQPDTAE